VLEPRVNNASITAFPTQYEGHQAIFPRMLGGLGLAWCCWSLFLSPLRQDVYFSADPEIGDIRSKLDQTRNGWPDRSPHRRNRSLPIPAECADQGLRVQRLRNRLGELAGPMRVPPRRDSGLDLLSALLDPAHRVCLALLPAFSLCLAGPIRFRPGRVKSQGKTARAQGPVQFRGRHQEGRPHFRIRLGGQTPPFPRRTLPRGSRVPARRRDEETPTAPLPLLNSSMRPIPRSPPGAKNHEPETVPIPLSPSP